MSKHLLSFFVGKILRMVFLFHFRLIFFAVHFFKCKKCRDQIKKIIERTNEYLSIRSDVKSKQESIGFFSETCGMFDSTYFDNSNRRPFVRQPSKLGMDDSDYVRLIVEHNIVRKESLKQR